MTLRRYEPEKAVTGPSYSLRFKAVATATSLGLAGYGIVIAMRFPLLQLPWTIQLLLLGAALMLGISYYWFMHARTTIDDVGIRQTGLHTRQVAWSDVLSVKILRIPYAGWLFPPRVVVRAGNSFMTFHSGTDALLVEFAKIARAYQFTR
ncbi:hypothetical protein [Janthinobacterium sp. 17J80-10]|uniref:hypothetical protein n=1 Tax=Janthinobacterium sp. 17J80-10 TaxID=2497863 RepID=UPI0010059838|nr:hypothetical protein [Janthinobacterium sp. 17J80-10]QAU32753.1 hypothetical protein EKL02_00420 [Janthinobacterium sp. 17J80-10]